MVTAVSCRSGRTHELEAYKLDARLVSAISTGNTNRCTFELCDDESQAFTVDGISDDDIRRYFGSVFEVSIRPSSLQGER